MESKTDNEVLREAIYKAFGGKCFYTGQEIRKEDMVIDHIMPKSSGGEDSIFNYVLTTKGVNSSKTNKVDRDGIAPILYLVKMVYAPKVLRQIKKLSPKKEKKAKGTRKLISVRPSIWGEIKVAAMLRCESIGDYLVGLHLGKEVPKIISEKVSKQGEIKKPTIVPKHDKPYTGVPVDMMQFIDDPIIPEDPQIPKEERIIKKPAVPQYTESKVDRIARINKELSKKRGNSG